MFRYSVLSLFMDHLHVVVLASGAGFLHVVARMDQVYNRPSSILKLRSMCANLASVTINFHVTSPFMDFDTPPSETSPGSENSRCHIGVSRRLRRFHPLVFRAKLAKPAVPKRQHYYLRRETRPVTSCARLFSFEIESIRSAFKRALRMPLVRIGRR